MMANLPHSEPDVAASDGVAKQFRRLKSNELVSRGDFVADPNIGFRPWEGPTGFRADSFIEQIYRKQNRRPAKSRK